MPGVARMLVLLLASVVLGGCARMDRASRSSLVGQAAPEISGTDLAGEPISLRDYRGKVVLLDFWQTFCPPCKMMHEHEKNLLALFGTEKFAVLGVNLDGDAKVGLKTQELDHMTWRSVWDSSGLINLRWGAQGTPWLYLIDAKGKVRQELPGAPRSTSELEKQIAALIEEGEAAKDK